MSAEQTAGDPRPTSPVAMLGQPRGRSSLVERGDHILVTASRLFSERGYSATRLNDVAEELGVTRAALYYYYPKGKSEILELVVSAAMVRAETILHDVQDQNEPVAALRAFAAAYALNITSAGARVFFRETSELSPEFREHQHLRARGLTVGVMRIFESGIANGALRADLDPRMSANALLGMLNWMSQWHWRERPYPDPTSTALAFTDLLLAGALAPGD